MDKIDKMIEDALRTQDRDIWAKTGELGYFQQAVGMFSGKQAWVNWVVMIVQSVMFFAGVWCAVNFYSASDVLLAVKWGISGGVLMLMAGLLKFTLTPVMQADRVIREIRRLELMLARAE